MKKLDWIIYFLAITVSCFVMLHIGIGITNWEYWVVCVCVIVSRISGLLTVFKTDEPTTSVDKS